MKDADLTYTDDENTIGLLTVVEFDRFTRAVNDARNHVSWWRIAGHIKSGDEDELSVRSSDPTIPLHATWLAAEEITNLLNEINQWATLEDVAKFGHEFALLITREVETAMHKWPMEDRPHKVRFLRCRSCQLMTLKYYPPRLSTPGNALSEPVPVNHPHTPKGHKAVTDLIPVTVKCTNCKAVEDPMNFAIDAALIVEENEIAKRRLGDRKRRPRTGEPVEINGVPVGEGWSGADDAPETTAVVVLT